jgi:cell division protein FtsB
MRQHLQSLLDSKEKQLQQAAALGERLLAQRVELEERVRLLQETDADTSDEITADMRERYRELADAVRAWDFGNVQLTATFTPSVGILFVHSFFLLVETSTVSFTFLRPLSSSSSSSMTVLIWFLSRSRTPMALSRLNLLRSKIPPEMNPNGQNLCLGHLLLSLAEQKMLLTGPMTLVRVTIQYPYAGMQTLTCCMGSEFAFEIGSGLLTEVRRLQSLLAERDKAIQDMKEEKDDLEKSMDSLRSALKSQEQTTGWSHLCFRSFSSPSCQTNTRRRTGTSRSPCKSFGSSFQILSPLFNASKANTSV